MEEFAQGGRLSPKKVKEFIPAGTLGIGEDGNVWLRKARKDGVTFWEEFLEIKDFRYFRVMSYDLKSGITFGGYLDESQEDVLQFTYKYNEGFIFTVINTETEKSNQIVYTYLERARSRAIEIRDNAENGRRQEEMTKVFTKIFDAFAKELLRNEFTEEKPDTPETPQPKFEIGDYVRVVERGYVVSTYTQKFLEYKFSNPNKEHLANNGYEGYVVAIFDDSMNHNRYAIKKLDAIGEILHEFIIDEKGLELVKKRPLIGDVVYIKDTNYLYPTAPTLKEKLGFSDPNSISKANEVYLSYGIIFSKGQDFILMPIYGINCTVLQQEVLMGIQGIQESQESKPESEPLSLRRKKVVVNNAKEAELLQEYAYSKGFAFLGEPKGKIVDFSPYPMFMQFTENDVMFGESLRYFNESDYSEVTLEELGLIVEIPTETPIEFVCNVDASKINSFNVGAFYYKNKERIEKLNSEFSCKILEALVYLSDYENCGGGVQLPIQEVVEEDDLLGAIRNLK